MINSAPAVGKVTGSPYFVKTDQRGLPRMIGNHVDIGAVEVLWALPQVICGPSSGLGTEA